EEFRGCAGYLTITRRWRHDTVPDCPETFHLRRCAESDSYEIIQWRKRTTNVNTLLRELLVDCRRRLTGSYHREICGTGENGKVPYIFENVLATITRGWPSSVAYPGHPVAKW